MNETKITGLYKTKPEDFNGRASFNLLSINEDKRKDYLCVIKEKDLFSIITNLTIDTKLELVGYSYRRLDVLNRYFVETNVFNVTDIKVIK